MLEDRTTAETAAKITPARPQQKAKTKVLIDNLPTGLAEDKFLELIKDYQEKFNYFDYYPGHKTQKSKICGKAYINFVSSDVVIEFFKQFSNHSFVDERGYKQKIMITYAPFQNIPNLEKKRENKREGTIEKDEEFLAFVAKLNEPKETLPSAEIQLEKRLAEESKLAAASGGVLPPILSPLLLDLQAKKERKAQRPPVEKRRKRPKPTGSSGTANKSAEIDPKKILLRKPAAADGKKQPETNKPKEPVAQATQTNQSAKSNEAAAPKPNNQRGKPQGNKPQGGGAQGNRNQPPKKKNHEWKPRNGPNPGGQAPGQTQPKKPTGQS